MMKMAVHDVNIHACDDFALRWAAEDGHTEICKLLLEHGANVHANHDDALRWATAKGHFETCKLLIEHGADLKVLFTEEDNPTEVAFKFATKEQIEQVKNELIIQKVIDS